MINNYYPLIIISLLPHKIRVTSKFIYILQGAWWVSWSPPGRPVPASSPRATARRPAVIRPAARCALLSTTTRGRSFLGEEITGISWILYMFWGCSYGIWWILLIFRDFLVELDGFCWFLVIFLWNLMFVFLSFRVFLLELLINNVQGYLWILMDLCCNNMCLFNCYLWMMTIVDLT